MPIGTCTLANMRLSLVSGTTFVDFSASDTLTPYINGKLTLTDSAGKKATGYIKAAGSSETLSDELLDAWTNSATAPFETWTVSGTDITQAINTDDTYGVGYKDITALTPAGKLYKVVNSSYTLNSGGAPVLSLSATGYNAIITLTKGGTTYGCATSAVKYLSIDGRYNPASNFALTGTSLKQVTAPSATGVTITSTPGGTTYNWASIESGFNYNDSAGYTYNISLSNEVLYEDNNILILNFKDCPVTNATQILVDVSDYNCNKLSIEKIWHSISGIATAILFDATTDDTAIILVGNDVWTFDTEFPNPKSTGFTGDLNMTISSAAAGDSYNIILRLRKY